MSQALHSDETIEEVSPDEVEFVAPNFRPRATRPRLGPALWTSGVLLWAYVALGRLVVNQEFPEALALLIVFCCFGVAAYLSIARSEQSEPSLSQLAARARAAQTLGLALLLFLGTVLVSALLGLATSDDLDELLSVLLVLLALSGIWFGRRLTGRASPVTAQRRALGVLGWIGAVAITLLAWAR